MEQNNILIKRIINLTIFEIKFNILAILILAPVLTAFAEIMATLLGFNYISFDIIQNNIGNYKVWSIIIIEFMLFTFMALIEIASSIIVFYKAPYKVILFKDIIKKSFSFIQILKKSPAILPVTGLVVLFTFFQTTVSSRIKIPAFIKEYILEDYFLSIVYYLIIFIVFCVVVRLIFIYNEIFLRKRTLSKSIFESVKITKGRFFPLIASLSMANILTYLSGFITTYLIDMIIQHYAYMQSLTYRNIFILSILRMIIMAVKFLRHAITVSIIRCVIYYFYEKYSNDIPINYIDVKVHRKARIRNYKTYIAIIPILIVNAIYFSFIVNKDLNISNKISVTAHRGGGKYEVENTLDAIKEGARYEADFAEVDVRLTKDEYLVLSHDKNFKRVFSESRNIRDLTLDEIKKLRTKSKDKKRYIAPTTLVEAINISKKYQIKLNIEIKGQNYSEYIKTANKVYEVMKEKDYLQTGIVSSLSLDALKQIKRCDNRIKTSLIVLAGLTNFEKITGVDYVAFEESLVDRNLVEYCHKRGIGVQIWTPNNRKSIFHAIENGVDNIITDNLKLTIEEINKFENLPIIGSRIMRLLVDE